MFTSVSSLTTSILSPYCSLISSRIGATLRHGPHHVAQKSTSTGFSLMRTSSAKVASVVFFRAMEVPFRYAAGLGWAGWVWLVGLVCLLCRRGYAEAPTVAA